MAIDCNHVVGRVAGSAGNEQNREVFLMFRAFVKALFPTNRAPHRLPQTLADDAKPHAPNNTHTQHTHTHTHPQHVPCFCSSNGAGHSISPHWMPAQGGVRVLSPKEFSSLCSSVGSLMKSLSPRIRNMFTASLQPATAAS